MDPFFLLNCLRQQLQQSSVRSERTANRSRENSAKRSTLGRHVETKKDVTDYSRHTQPRPKSRLMAHLDKGDSNAPTVATSSLLFKGLEGALRRPDVVLAFYYAYKATRRESGSKGSGAQKTFARALRRPRFVAVLGGAVVGALGQGRRDTSPKKKKFQEQSQ